MVRNVFKKVGMTSIFDGQGNAQAVTLLECIKGVVLRFEALADGKGDIAVVQFETGLKHKMTRGFKVPSRDLAVGSEIAFPALNVGSVVKVTGVSKGKGFQDAMTRHNFAGGPGSHGSRFHRAPGSVGMRTQPGRTPKGKKLPGHDGCRPVSVMGLKVAHVSSSDGTIAVHGSVPGPTGAFVFV